jgi:hypothetical protein
MRTVRRAFRWWAAAAVPALLASAASGAAAGEAGLAGRVVGSAGAGVEDAVVYLIRLGGADPVSASGRPGEAAPGVLVLRTDRDGVFSAVLPAAHYKVAALKPGFDLLLADIDTRVRATLELRLKRASRLLFGDRPDAASDPRGLGWILRETGEDVLQDRRADVPVPASQRESPGRRLQAILGPIDGEFTQHLSGADLLGSPGSGDSNGRATTLALRGAIGGQGAWQFAGLSGREQNAPLDGAGARQGRRADRMQVGLDYRLGPDDNLKADLRYGISRYVVDPNGETVNATDQEQTSAGLHSRWDRRLGATAALYVDGSYAETGVRLPEEGASPFAALPGDSASLHGATDRSWLATAGVAFQTGEHHVDVGLRAKAYRYDLRDRGVLLYSLDDSPALTEAGERGEAMSLYGSDDWRLAAGPVVNYGLRYHSSLSAGTGYLVPRLGITLPLQDPESRVRSSVLYRLDDPGLASPYAGDPGSPGSTRDVGRLGYLVSFERRPAERLQVSATLSYRPFEEGMGEDDGSPMAPGAWGDALLFLTDGAAGRHDLGLSVARGFGRFHGALSGNVGRVEGRLTPALEEAPVQILSLGEVRYYLTRIQAHYDPTDTELRIDYREVRTATGLEAGADPTAFDYRRLDLTVSQDVPLRNAPNARFRLLMAYQGLLYGASYEGTGPAPAPPLSVASRLTGGVDVRF